MTLSVPEFVALVLATYVAGAATATAVFALLTRTRITPEAAEAKRDAAAIAAFHRAANVAMQYDRARRGGGTR